MDFMDYKLPDVTVVSFLEKMKRPGLKGGLLLTYNKQLQKHFRLLYLGGEGNA